MGSAAVFALRHRSLFGGAKQDIQQIAQVIAINMVRIGECKQTYIIKACYSITTLLPQVIGFLSRSIDNWGHVNHSQLYANLSFT